jgi:hypothetical protein
MLIIKKNQYDMTGVFTEIPVKKGDVIGTIEGRKLAEPTKYSIQTGLNEHIEVIGELRYMNHLCQPTATIIDKKSGGITRH